MRYYNHLFTLICYALCFMLLIQIFVRMLKIQYIRRGMLNLHDGFMLVRNFDVGVPSQRKMNNFSDNNIILFDKINK